ncbi:acetyltransferase [Leptospira ilyithenensis]|uniref:Acetyltransferase n=1 Tax=Leptospira ilyithenensis TaxID=2484901 RepID=A0A4R9LMS4_9LEPT|nr:acetyltransferase [Leptospira ilyithenensis]TGN07997.1 acetyltransferase [Leptospira ilyithenensis]
MERKNYLIACGGHGRVLLDTLLLNQVNVDGIIDPNMKEGTQVFGITVIGDDSFILSLNPSEIRLINGIGVQKNTNKRKEIYEEWTFLGYEFLGGIHPSALISSECSLSSSAQIMAGAVLQNRVIIKDNAVINTRASIDHDCSIGKHAFVSPGAIVCGGVTIGDSAFVGAGAILLPGLIIGENAVIGAGAVVTKNVPPNVCLTGNPARIVKS